MIELSAQALERAENTEDILEVLHICSGVFALENEITLFGEKFAAAVKAFAIIDSVDKALSKMNRNATALANQGKQDIDKMRLEIDDLSSTIQEKIEEKYSKHSVSDNEAFPPDVLEELHLNKEYLFSSLVSGPKSFFEKLLQGWFFGLGRVKFNDKHKQSTTEKVTSVADDFSRNFLEKRQRLLERQRDAFIKTVEGIIHNNGKLSDEAKSYVLDIRPPEIEKILNITDFGDIYDAHKRVSGFLWFDTEYIDKDGFLEDADRRLTNLATAMEKDFRKDYCNSLNSILCAVKSEYSQNLKEYSLFIKAKSEDIKAMQCLHEKILVAAKELADCQAELNQIIWEAKSDEQ
jgi:hypothetical protein